MGFLGILVSREREREIYIKYCNRYPISILLAGQPDLIYAGERSQALLLIDYPIVAAIRIVPIL